MNEFKRGDIVEICPANNVKYPDLINESKNQKYFEILDFDKYGRCIIDGYYKLSDGITTNVIQPKNLKLNIKETRKKKINDIKSKN